MLVWRLYVNGECARTFGDGPLAQTLAIAECQKWFEVGYTAEQVEVKHEEF